VINFAPNSEQMKKMRRLIIMAVVLWVIFLIGIYSSVSVSELGGSFKETQIAEDKGRYSFYNYLLLQFLGVSLSFEAGRFQIVVQGPRNTHPDGMQPKVATTQHDVKDETI
jgi:hypothetical protein